MLQEIPEEMMHGPHIHCRPVRRGPMVEATVVTTRESAVTNKLVICPARMSNTGCLMRQFMNEPLCLYPGTKYIIGPEEG
jgi:hypothetical protein